ncbi:MAG: 4-hydroxy-3-methylbut-2-enyl diphosphate reductase [Desulfovermiculus sp.]|nr:4-hydroxy-3-methylbut-2-enyl diphosphate reductase [Desulfovermiculus sp.]
MSKTIIRAKTAGFCMGVDLALRKLDQVLAENSRHEQICTLGPIIHNPQVLQDYADQGVIQVNCAQDLPEGCCVVIRAHGVPLAVKDELHNQGVRIVDATCPKVKKAQMLIADQTQNGRFLLLFGEPDHPEVAGLLSYAASQAQVIEHVDMVEALDLHSEQSYFLAAQTTQDRREFQTVFKRLENRLGKGFPVLDTICDATRQRQEEAVAISRQVDVMLVVGGYTSGNTRRLAKVVQAQGVPSIHIESVRDLPEGELGRAGRVGITAGASTPRKVIDAVEAKVAGWGDEYLAYLNCEV